MHVETISKNLFIFDGLFYIYIFWKRKQYHRIATISIVISEEIARLHLIIDTLILGS